MVSAYSVVDSPRKAVFEAEELAERVQSAVARARKSSEIRIVKPKGSGPRGVAGGTAGRGIGGGGCGGGRGVVSAVVGGGSCGVASRVQRVCVSCAVGQRGVGGRQQRIVNRRALQKAAAEERFVGREGGELQLLLLILLLGLAGAEVEEHLPEHVAQRRGAGRLGVLAAD